VPRHPCRLDPADYRGYRAYSLTICTRHRSRPFIDAAIVQQVLLQFLRVAAGQRWEILAYCFMPDHVHMILIAHAEDADLQRLVRLAKQRSGFMFSRLSGRQL
jgi:putative transposase